MRWQQKLALGASLDLRVFVVVAGVVLVAGISSGRPLRLRLGAVLALPSSWANVALIMNSATALRMLFRCAALDARGPRRQGHCA
jgi:hypothetical protein